jgi:hypothetical protein
MIDYEENFIKVKAKCSCVINELYKTSDGCYVNILKKNIITFIKSKHLNDKQVACKIKLECYDKRKKLLYMTDDI